jgi:hypothetical protein
MTDFSINWPIRCIHIKHFLRFILFSVLNSIVNKAEWNVPRSYKTKQKRITSYLLYIIYIHIGVRTYRIVAKDDSPAGSVDRIS